MDIGVRRKRFKGGAIQSLGSKTFRRFVNRDRGNPERFYYVWSKMDILPLLLKALSWEQDIFIS
jgi:hypothetical protein